MVDLLSNQPDRTIEFTTSEISSLLDCIAKPAFLVQHQKIIAVNSKATELTAYTRRELTNKLVEQVIHPFELDNFSSQTSLDLSESRSESTVSMRHGTQISASVEYIRLTDETFIITMIPLIEVDKSQVKNAFVDFPFLDFLEVIRSLQNQDPQVALLRSLEAGYRVMDTSILALYVGDGHKPRAKRVAYNGKIEIFPPEIYPVDFNHFLKPTMWVQGQKSILTILHQKASSAGLSYLATCPVGDLKAKALVGILVAGGYQNPPPRSCLDYLQILSEIISNIISKNAFISGLNGTIRKYEENISILQKAKEIISDGIIMVSTDFKILEINQTAENTLGYNASDVISREITEIMIGSDRIGPALESAFQGIPTPNLGQLKLHRRDGLEFPAEIGIFPIQYENKILGAFIILRDKSEQVQNRTRTRQLEQRALLGEVTAIFAHEVRNPINNISTGLQLLAVDVDEKDESYEVINRILQDCNRLDDLMESVLTFSRTGNYEFKPLKMGYLLKNLAKSWTPRMKRVNIDPIITMPDNTIEVIGDKRALEQVFTNLISNAIQAMEELGGGNLGIKLSSFKTQNGREFIQVDISDTGPGISKENRQRIFEPFFSTKENGTGLGLAITKQIVTAHKGSINLTSVPGGTVFQVKIPAYNSKESI